MENHSVAKLKEIATRLEIKGISKCSKAELCEKIEQEIEFSTNKPVERCNILSVPLALISPPLYVYRARWWDNKKPTMNDAQWYTVDPADLLTIRNFRIHNHPKGPEQGSKAWPSLSVDIFESVQNLTLIGMSSNWGYEEMENAIKAYDPKYEPGIEEHPHGDIPIGDNGVPANWLNTHRCYDGWWEPRESNNYMAELLLTKDGNRKLRLIKTRSVSDILDDIFIHNVQPF